MLFASLHCLFVGPNYLGSSQFTWVNGVMIIVLTLAITFILLVRSSFIWSLLSLEKLYVPPKKS